jgi:hypothetical protein
MTNRPHLVLPASLAAWSAQGIVAVISFALAIGFGDKISVAEYARSIAGGLTLFLVIYIPQFLFIFSPITYLLRKLNQNGLTVSVFAGIAASLLGIPFNMILLSPFASDYPGPGIAEAFNRPGMDMFAATGGAAAGCAYWLVANIERLRRGRTT